MNIHLFWQLHIFKDIFSHQTSFYPSSHLLKHIFSSSPSECVCVCMCVCDLVAWHNLGEVVGFLPVTFFKTYFVSCNRPCAPKEKWHRKEHIFIIVTVWQIFNVGFFSDTARARSSKLCNFAWDLQCHSRFDALDFVSGSQVCQKYELQIACFGFLSFVV